MATNPSSSDSPAQPPLFALAQRAGQLKPSAIREILKLTEAPGFISFAGGLPAAELFPVEAVKAAAQRVLEADGPAALQYGVTEGYGPLKQWLAAYLKASVGIDALPQEILITNGSQQGLDLLGKVLLDPGDRILVENPGYLGALQAFRAYEAEVEGVRSDEGGMCLDALADALQRGPRPKFLYLIPNYQNPTGVSLDEDRRAAVVQLAERHGIPIIEDDPYGALRYSGPPSIALAKDSPTTVYLGTTSKILTPGLRVAWMVVKDAALRDKLVSAKQAADLHTSSFTQRVVYEVLRQPGLLDEQISTLRRVYGTRRDRMLQAMETAFPVGTHWTRPQGGLFVWVTLPDGVDTLALLEIAMTRQVAFVPGQSFWVKGERRNTLRLNFSNASELNIDRGMAALGQVLQGIAKA